MLLNIKIIREDPTNSKKYVRDVLKINLKKLLKIKTKETTYQRKIRKKFTTLKSPHAHKDAQTSFELVSYDYTSKLKSNQLSKFLSYYKKIYCRLIPDTKVKMTFKVCTAKEICRKRNMFRHFKHSTNKKSLTDYLTELGFFGKDSFHCVLSDV